MFWFMKSCLNQYQESTVTVFPSHSMIEWRYSHNEHSAIPCCSWGCHGDNSRRNQTPQSTHYDNTPLYCVESIMYPLNTNIMQLYITPLSYGNNVIMDIKSATLVNPLSHGKLLHHTKAVSFKLISRHLGHPWQIILPVHATRPYCWLVNVVPGIGLVLFVLGTCKIFYVQYW